MKNIYKILNKYAESTTKGICDPGCQLHNCRPLRDIDPEYPPGFGIFDVNCNHRAATLMGICNLCVNTTARARCKVAVEKFFKSCKEGVESCKIYESACRGSTPPAKETACACFVESCHISGLQAIIEDAYDNCDYFLGRRFQETMRELDINREFNLQSCEKTLDFCTRTSTPPAADEASPRGDDMDEPPIQSM